MGAPLLRLARWRSPQAPVLSGNDYGNRCTILKKYQINQRSVAEREGFEPSIRLPVCRISSAVHSTTLPPLREMKTPPEGGAVDTGGLMT